MFAWLACIGAVFGCIVGISISHIFMYREFKRIVKSEKNFKVRGKWYQIIKREDLDEL